MKNKIYLILLLILPATIPSMAQYLIQGVVTDAKTHEPIPFASVGVPDLRIGTSTNLNGEFLLRVDSLPVTLAVTHISYIRQNINVTDDSPLHIALLQSQIVMGEVVIAGKSETDYAYDLLENAFDRAVGNANKESYGKAFYRQISQNDSDYSELYEIFYDTKFSSQGITDWAVQEGRYAMDRGPGTSDYVYSKNFTLLSRVFMMFQPETDQFIMPVNRNVRTLYDLKVIGTRNIDGHTAVVVDFAPKKDITTPAMTGEILIDSKTYDIYMISGAIKNDKFNVIDLTNPAGSWKNYVIQFTCSYKRDDDGKMLLDYIKFDQQFDYYIEGVFRHKVTTHSFLTYYEYYTPEKRKNLGGRIIRFSQSDRDILNKIGYNREFWAENPIVKRTPLENSVIASFEAVNAFGSIYLNDKDQVQLESYDIDKDPFIQQLMVSVLNTRLASKGEKVYLHLDKPYYATGETMWFSAYLVNEASLVPDYSGSVIYVDLIDPQGSIKEKKVIKVDSRTHEGTIDIPSDYSSGMYRVRAYTNWMKNQGSDFFFDQPVAIYNAEEISSGSYITAEKYAGFDVNFYPEGGNLIKGIPSQVAFEALDERGKGIDVTGKIVDSQGNQVATISTRHDGLGGIFLLPKAGQKYTAIVDYLDDEKKFTLPEALDSGITASVNTLKNNVIQVIVRGTSSFNNRNIYLVGQSRGIIYYREKVKLVNGNAIVTVPRNKLPAGIFHLTLFDDQKIPWFERLVFIKPDNELNTDLQCNNNDPGYREPVKISLKIRDQFGKPVVGAHLSVAVTDASKIMKPEYDQNIETYLLLQSDLKGPINNPGYYFKDDDRETLQNLDLLMLVHGWSRFHWKEILNKKVTNPEYLRESGIDISGTAYKAETNIPFSYGAINFISINTKYPGIMSSVTDQNGRFTLYSMDIPDTVSFFAQGYDSKGKLVKIDIRLDKKPPYPAMVKSFQQYPADVNAAITKYLNNEQQYALITTGADKRVMLKEVVIAAKKFEKSYNYEADNTYIPGNESYGYTNIYQMISGRFAGVTVMGNRILVRGISSINAGVSPLFLIDGVQVSSDSGQVSSVLSTITPSEVERIDLIKNPANLAIFGVRGANGVIAIYMKNGYAYESPAKEKNFSEVTLRGYSLVRDFYSPKYDGTQNGDNIPDIRSLLYWNPDLKTDRRGEASFNYYNSDSARKHQVVVEGISNFGDTIFSEKTIGQDNP